MKPRNTCLSASDLHAFGILSLTAIMMDFALHTQLASAGEAARQHGETLEAIFSFMSAFLRYPTCAAPVRPLCNWSGFDRNWGETNL
jgi:hypothetical protein